MCGNLFPCLPCVPWGKEKKSRGIGFLACEKLRLRFSKPQTKRCKHRNCAVIDVFPLTIAPRGAAKGLRGRTNNLFQSAIDLNFEQWKRFIRQSLSGTSRTLSFVLQTIPFPQSLSPGRCKRSLLPCKRSPASFNRCTAGKIARPEMEQILLINGIGEPVPYILKSETILSIFQRNRFL